MPAPACGCGITVVVTHDYNDVAVTIYHCSVLFVANHTCDVTQPTSGLYARVCYAIASAPCVDRDDSSDDALTTARVCAGSVREWLAVAAARDRGVDDRLLRRPSSAASNPSSPCRNCPASPDVRL